MSEFIVHELIEKNLSDDFEFIPIVSESVIRTDPLEIIYEIFGFVHEVVFYHMETWLYSLRYSLVVALLIAVADFVSNCISLFSKLVMTIGLINLSK